MSTIGFPSPDDDKSSLCDGDLKGSEITTSSNSTAAGRVLCRGVVLTRGSLLLISSFSESSSGERVWSSE